MPVANLPGVTGASPLVQAPAAQAFHACATVGRRSAGRRRALALLLVPALGGCAAGQSMDAINPVDWWHKLEGGTIAETRPPPPNADAPYPSLGSVPAKPPPPDAKLHASMAGGLVADRANAQYDAKVRPLTNAAAPAARRPPPPAASGDAEQSNATLQAANAQPVAPVVKAAPVATVATVVKAAPVAPVASAPLAPPPAAAPASPGEAAMPAMPEAPPPPPSFAAAAVPAVTAPTLPPVAPPPPPSAVPAPGAPVAIPFPPDSALLPPDALAPIKQLARSRGSQSIAVTGFGGATSTETADQSAALPLALSRARAVAAGLVAAGVPSTAIRIAAEPQGTGAAARLVN